MGEALHLLRTRKGLPAAAASERDGAPDEETLGAWESDRTMPKLESLDRYLAALSLDFRALQEALDEVEGRGAGRKADVEFLPRFPFMDVS